jgi:hypothetical protein
MRGTGATSIRIDLNPDCPLGRHTGEGRYPAMGNTPRSGQSHDFGPLAWEIFNLSGFRPSPE